MVLIYLLTLFLPSFGEGWAAICLTPGDLGTFSKENMCCNLCLCLFVCSCSCSYLCVSTGWRFVDWLLPTATVLTWTIYFVRYFIAITGIFPIFICMYIILYLYDG